MVEELGGQCTATGRNHGGFSIGFIQILDCLDKQLASKQRGVLLACLSASLMMRAWTY